MNAHELEGKVSVTVDGQERFLRFTQRAVRLLMDKLGLQTLPELASRMKAVDIDVVNSSVWAGLQWEENPPKWEEMEDKMIPLAPAVDSVTRAINIALFGFPGGSQDASGPQKSETNQKPSSSG